ncbi:hypothetical protein XCR1_1430037 [Xenorhabdus cabanillasii JM26]|uniref:Uncharacterized protein n=1 Tax=Xenorhabdus cabanillasii JM26 TaxID=1427517 RepID=W1ISR8_9GAMM|nr:hypothetical protein XCR1_1430037 [Xenorhabdus cabanillasii JM26]
MTCLTLVPLNTLDKERLIDDVVRQWPAEQSETIAQIMNDFWTGILYHH